MGMDEYIGKFHDTPYNSRRLPAMPPGTQIEVVPFAVDMIAAASRLYEARSDKDWSLTDCLSFMVMEQRRVPRALTTDHHFRQAGLEAVLLGDPPSPG